MIVAAMLSPAARAQSTWLRQASSSPDPLNAVAHGDGTWVAVGKSGAVVTSSDASNWSAASPGSGTAANLRAVVYSHGQFIAAGQNGTLLSSPDGATWTARSSGVSAFFSGLASDGARLVAVGASGTIITSTDGVTWAATSSGVTDFLQHVHHGAGLFVAIGESGRILTSADGLSWSPSTSPTGSFLLGGGYLAGRHFVIGQNGLIASSADGASWSQESSGTLNGLRAFASDGTTAVVVGDGGTLLTSADGTTWSTQSSGRTERLNGARFSDNRFVVVGEPATDNDAVILRGERNPGILWSASTVSVGEATGSVTLPIERLGPTIAPAMIDYQAVAGSATAEIDFTAFTGTASFAIGERTVEVVIPVANNPEAEPPEEFTVTLSNPDPATLTLYPPDTATITIIDAQDSDNDGLTDDWEILYFGNVEAYGPADDPDGDNNSNQRELADGTNPDDPASASYLLTLGVASGQGTVSALPDLASYPTGTMITVIPTGTAPFSFSSWQGDASGTADPLVISITGDLLIEAGFEVTLAEALDEPTLDWSVGGSGPAWAGQVDMTSDGVDAAAAGGLAVGQESRFEATVHGPATVGFDWKASIGSFDSLKFQVDSSSRATLSGVSDWTSRSFLVGAGEHTLRWTYRRGSSLSSGSNQAWVDQVTMSYGFADWQLAYFDLIERADPLISGVEADPDGDEIPNLLEFLFDLHPKFVDPFSPRLPAISFVESGGQSFPTLSWSQHHYRADTLSLVVEFSTTLKPGSWQPLDVPIEVVSNDGAIDTVRVIHPDPSSLVPTGFLRLGVTLP